MIICNITPSRRAADAAWLADLVAQTSVPVVSLAGFEEVKPLPGEPVLNKTTISAFTSAGIDSLLRSMNIQYVLFSGVSTNMCVGTTARDAADRGYRCLLIEDCCGSAQNEYHRGEIVTFQRLFGRVDSSENVMKEIGRNLDRSPHSGSGSL